MSADGLLLTQPELLVLFDALHVNDVIGVARSRLFPTDVTTQRSLIFSGIETLIERGLLRTEASRYILSQELLEWARIVSDPALVLATLHESADRGKRIWLHYLRDNRVIEQTFPDETTYRWGELRSWEAVLDRVLRIVPLPAGPTSAASATTTRPRITQCAELAQRGDMDIALQILADDGLRVADARRFAALLATPDVIGTFQMVRALRGAVVSGWNLTVVRDGDEAWQYRPVRPRANQVQVKRTDAARVRRALDEMTDVLQKEKPDVSG